MASTEILSQNSEGLKSVRNAPSGVWKATLLAGFRSSLVGRPCEVLIPSGLGEIGACCWAPEGVRGIGWGCKDALVLIGFRLLGGAFWPGPGEGEGLGRSDILADVVRGEE